MLRRNQTQLFWMLVSLLALRLIIGWHFYTEGVSKLKSGNFTAEPFFRGAKGPLADFFQQFIPDYDGRMRLGLVQTQSEDGKSTLSLDPLVTEELWKGFAYRAAAHYGFGDPEYVDELSNRALGLKQRINQEEAQKDAGVSIESLRNSLKETATALEIARGQKEAVLAVAQKYIDEYRGFLAENEPEILAYFRGADRVQGFDRDGQYRAAVVDGVSSLRDQTDRIISDRAKDARPWLGEVDQMWNGVEADVNALAVADQSSRGYLKLDRPHQDRWAMLPWLDRIVPWFDTIVGVCLMLGLFTRFASLAGASFLGGIIATQPPFIAGTAPTIYQSIELIGLLVLFAAGAGRVAGLDVLFSRRNGRRMQPNEIQELSR